MGTENKTLTNNHIHDDEIDLYELWQTLWSQKWLIAAITIITTASAAVFSLNIPKTYQAEMRVLPPLTSSIEAIQLREVASLGIDTPNADSLYSVFLENLDSSEVINMFLSHQSVRDYYLEDNLSPGRALRQIDKSLEVNRPVEPREKVLFLSKEATLKYQAQQPEFTVEALSLLADSAASYTIAQVRTDLLTSINQNITRLDSQINLENQRVNREIEAEIKRLEESDQQHRSDLTQSFDLENQRVNREIQAEIKRLEEADQEKRESLSQQIALLRDKAKLDREFRIARLKVDYNIAKSLGIETPVNPADYNRQASNVARVEISNQNLSRYWLGTKALSQEILAMESRSSDDPFIPELPDLLRQLDALKVNHRIERLKNRVDNFPFSEDLRNIKAKLDKLQEPNIKILTLKNREDNVPFSDSLRNLINQKQKLLEAKQKAEQAEFEVYRIARAPVEPESPIKPNKKLIVAVALVLGGMLGIFIALVRGAVRKRQTITANQTPDPA